MVFSIFCLGSSDNIARMCTNVNESKHLLGEKIAQTKLITRLLERNKEFAKEPRHF